MSDERIVRRTLENRRKGQTDWERIDAMTEEEIEENARSDPDNPLWTEEELERARLVMPGEREEESAPVHLDRDVVDFFKRNGSDFQSRINAVLRAYVRSRQSE